MKLDDYVIQNRHSWAAETGNKSHRRKPAPNHQAVEALLSESPKNTHQIAEALGWSLDKVHTTLFRMKHKGKVEKVNYWKIK